MANAELFLSARGGTVVTLPPTASALDAALLMTDHHVGSIVVVEDERIVGIFTERDVLRRVVAAQLDPASTPLSEVMSSPVLCAAPRTLLDELRSVMRERRIRHVPVVDDDRLLGMISLGDLNRVERQVQERTIEYLSQFVTTM